MAPPAARAVAPAAARPDARARGASATSASTPAAGADAVDTHATATAAISPIGYAKTRSACCGAGTSHRSCATHAAPTAQTAARSATATATWPARDGASSRSTFTARAYSAARRRPGLELGRELGRMSVHPCGIVERGLMVTLRDEPRRRRVATVHEEVVHRLHPRDDRCQERVAALEAVAVAQEPQATGRALHVRRVVADARRVERREAPRGVGEIPEARAGAGEVPVDERDGLPVAEDHVPGPDVVVADHLAVAGADAPARVRGRDEPRDGIVEAPRERAGVPGSGVVIPEPGRRRPRHLALDEFEDLPAAFVDPAHPRRLRKAGRLEVAQQRVDGRRPRPGLPPDRVADPYDGAEVPARERLLDLH